MVYTGLWVADSPIAGEEQGTGGLEIKSANSRRGRWIKTIGSQDIYDCRSLLLLLLLLLLHRTTESTLSF